MMTDPDMKRLDDLLREVAAEPSDVSPHLMQAVLRDAAQVMPPPARAGVWQGVLEMIGGWPALGGMAVAGVAGVWLGLAPPVGLETVAVEAFGANTTIDLFGGDGLARLALEEVAQ